MNQKPPWTFSNRRCGADTPGGIEPQGPALTVRSKTSSLVATDPSSVVPQCGTEGGGDEAQISLETIIQSLLTSLRTKCYDLAGVGCYFFSGLLTDISSGTKLSGGCGRARLPTSPVCREATVREDAHPPGFKKFSV